MTTQKLEPVFGKVISIYPLFILAKSLIGIKNVFFEIAVTKWAAEIAANLKSEFFRDIGSD